MRNVALFGQMASGKSAIAQGLVDSGYIRIAFAAPLKNISELAYGPIDKAGEYTVTGLDGEITIVSGREILQRVGQSIKSHDRDFWLRCFFRSCEIHHPRAIVVDDGRFLFERDALKSRGWLIVGIDTPADVRWERYHRTYGRYPTEVELTHPSEIELPDIISSAELIIDGTASPASNVMRILEHENDTAQTYYYS